MRNCEKCGFSYSTGKDYGDSIHSIGNQLNETRGLCPLCNPKSQYYIGDWKVGEDGLKHSPEYFKRKLCQNVNRV